MQKSDKEANSLLAKQHTGFACNDSLNLRLVYAPLGLVQQTRVISFTYSNLLVIAMQYNIYQVDAFTDKLFSGNPAAVVPMNEWPADALMQQIAMENNLAETAFYVKRDGQYEIRWFTPAVEVDLCGHATLAAAYVLFNHESHIEGTIQFHSPRSGPLTVKRAGDILMLNFPADIFEAIPLTNELTDGFDILPIAAFKGKTDYMLVFETESQVKDIIPNLPVIAKLGGRGVIVTAPGETVDFVSRFFAPQAGIDEDPVTGSAHTTLAPYWAAKLGKNAMTAIQLSPRKGHLHCTLLGERVEISGQAVLYMKGEILHS